MDKKSGLGRGLGSLIPNRLSKSQIAKLPNQTNYSYPESKEMIDLIPIDKIQTNPHQPRKNFPSTGLEELVASIKEHGILQPLIVTRTAAGYQLITGERRWRAAKMLDFKTVPAIIRTASSQKKLELSLVENLQRQDLNPIEEAQAYKQLMEEFNLIQEEIVRRVGKQRSTIANTLRLLNLPSKIQEALSSGQITAGHAKILLAIDDQGKQLAVLKQIIDQGYTTRETQAKFVSSKLMGIKSPAIDPQLTAWEEELRQKLGTKIIIQKQGKKGRIVIEFYSLAELKGLIEKLMK